MQTSSLPKLIPVPFADAGAKQDIPTDSQVGLTAGRASYTDGFPPLTRTPLAAGGVPPFGTDFNGVLNDITSAIRWGQAGGGYPFSSSFNTLIAGYPKGARVPNSTLDGFWLNTTDGNTANPENTTSALTGWVPSGSYGVTAITGLAGSSVTLTTLQASKDRITLAGALTSNINIVVPAWLKRWEIINNTTGSFSVTIKTPSGTGVSIASGSNANVVGDGVNISNSFSPGSLIGPPILFTSSGTYSPTPGTKSVVVEVQGAGGGAGGIGGAGSTTVAIGNGGGAGAYAKSRLSSGFSGASISVGIGGSGGNLAPTNGSTGGSSSFGTIVALGGGGGLGQAQATPPFGATGSAGGVASGGNILNSRGMASAHAFALNTTSVAAGHGGTSVLGTGGFSSAVNGAAGSDGYLYGGGGGGGYRFNGSGFSGGAGANGVVIIWEYA